MVAKRRRGAPQVQTDEQLLAVILFQAKRLMAGGMNVSYRNLRGTGRLHGDDRRIFGLLDRLIARGDLPPEIRSKRPHARRSQASTPPPRPIKPTPAPDLWAWLRTHYYTPARREWYRRVTA